VVADVASATSLWHVLARWQERGLSDDGATLVALLTSESLATHHREQAGGSCHRAVRRMRVGCGAPTNAPFPPETYPGETHQFSRRTSQTEAPSASTEKPT
jgi:hypothetical protein